MPANPMRKAARRHAARSPLERESAKAPVAKALHSTRALRSSGSPPIAAGAERAERAERRRRSGRGKRAQARSAEHALRGGHPGNSPRNWVDPSGFAADGVSSFDGGYTFSPDAITSTPSTGSTPGTGTSGGGAGVLALPPNVGSWTPGADQTADVMPSGANDTSRPADGSVDWRGATSQGGMGAKTGDPFDPSQLTPSNPALTSTGFGFENTGAPQALPDAWRDLLQPLLTPYVLVADLTS